MKNNDYIVKELQNEGTTKDNNIDLVYNHTNNLIIGIRKDIDNKHLIAKYGHSYDNLKEIDILIKKRDNSFEKFDINKINNALIKAFNAVQLDFNLENINSKYLTEIITEIFKVTKIDTSLLNNYNNDKYIYIEDIQDIIENILIKYNYNKVAKSFILYRKQHENIRKAASTILDYKKLVDSYVNINDWRVKENSTVTYSVGGLILSNSGAITANYWLSEIYDDEIANAHKNADIHLHDLSMLTGYCAGWSLRQLITEGLGGIDGKITSSPAAHLSTLCNQIVNFLGIMQNEWAGAQALSSFDTYLAPFVKIDNLSYKQVKQCIQSFVYGVNTPSRWGTQAPFTNITLDWTCPSDLGIQNAIIAGKEQSFRYKDCQKEMDIINKAFLEIMLEGDANGRGFQYPIPTYSITKDFDWSDTPNNKLLFDMTAKYGTPYFSNYVNSDMEPSDVRSMCCRLRLDLRELRKKSGGYFGSGESTGSIGVVTINLPKIAYLSKDSNEFYNRLDKMIEISARSLDIKRKTITSFLNNGLYPYTKKYLGNFNNHFSTIGIIGMNEAGLNANWLQKDLTHKETQEFAKYVLNHIRNKLSDYQELYGDLFNLEATPAESTSYRLAKHDKENYPNIKTANSSDDAVPYYTNSSHLPVNFTDDVFSALEIQDELQTLYTSGTVFHAFIGEKLPGWKSAANLVKKIADNYTLPYYTISPTYSVCKEHGYIAGEVYECPICHKSTEVYSRITGYYRPIKNWNVGKSQEYKDRKVYKTELKDNSINNFNNNEVNSSNNTLDINDEKINKLILLTSNNCAKCKAIKNILNDNNINFTEVDIMSNKYSETILSILKSKKIYSIPVLLTNNTNISNDLSDLLNNNNTKIIKNYDDIIFYINNIK